MTYKHWGTWRRAWQPTSVSLPGESHGQRGLAGYSPWGGKELDTTERLNSHTHSWVPETSPEDMNVTAPRAVSKPLTELLPENQKSDRGEPPSSVHPPQAGHSAPPWGLWGEPGPLILRRSHLAGPWAPPRTPQHLLTLRLDSQVPGPSNRIKTPRLSWFLPFPVSFPLTDTPPHCVWPGGGFDSKAPPSWSGRESWGRSSEDRHVTVLPQNLSVQNPRDAPSGLQTAHPGRREGARRRP